MDFASELDRWRQSTNKGAPKWYESEEFCRQYTDQELPKKTNIAYRLINGLLTAAVIEILQRTSNKSGKFDVLSLGCGPGSDLLAVIRAFESLESVFENHSLRTVRINCTGVDLSSQWRQMRGVFYAQMAQFKAALHILPTFITEEMEGFVEKALADRKQYDFITLSFTDADKRINLIGRKLPRLVKEGGRIFVIMYQCPTVKLENRHQEVEEIDFFEEECTGKKWKRWRLQIKLQKCVKLLEKSED